MIVSCFNTSPLPIRFEIVEHRMVVDLRLYLLTISMGSEHPDVVRIACEPAYNGPNLYTKAADPASSSPLVKLADNWRS
jgi:hypothetical protein